MPWYKLPHADMVMHFDREMDLEPADEPKGAHVWGTGPGVTFDADPRLIPATEEETEAT